ncbi:neurotrophin-3-like isoform X2 [Ptychodera flava]
MKIFSLIDEFPNQRMMKFVLGTILLLSVCSNMTEAAPRVRRTHRNSEERAEDYTDRGGIDIGVLPKFDFQTPADISSSVNPAFSSNLVTFSAEKPTAPPWQFSALGDPNTIYDEDTESVESFGRRKRLIRHHPERQVCDSKSRWVTKEWAIDVYNHNVTILSHVVTNDNQTVRQYFWETTCKDTGETAPPNSCRGIDKRHYTSQCKEKKALVHARIREDGRDTWAWLPIKSSCVCALRRKPEPLIRTTREALLYALLNRNWRE